jgi:hypothetical protein
MSSNLIAGSIICEPAPLKIIGITSDHLLKRPTKNVKGKIRPQ